MSKGKASKSNTSRSKKLVRPLADTEDSVPLIANNNPVFNTIATGEKIDFTYAPRGNKAFVVECYEDISCLFKIILFGNTPEEIEATLKAMMLFYEETFATYQNVLISGGRQTGKTFMFRRWQRFHKVKNLIAQGRYKLTPLDTTKVVRLNWRTTDLLT